MIRIRILKNILLIKRARKEFNTAIPFSSDIFSGDVEQRLDNLAQRVIESDNIIFTGVGSSGLICDYSARRLAGVGINTFHLAM